MPETIFHNGGWVFDDIKLKADRDVNIFISHLPEEVKKDDINIYVCSIDPQEYRASNEDIIGSAKAFDAILTCDKSIMNRCKNAHHFNFGYTFVSDKYDYWSKDYGIAFLSGVKDELEGHKLRHKVYDRMEEIRNTTIAYKTLPDKKYKDMLFRRQFVITIENVKRENYFTEKLIDCLYTKTVPIYWGCPNVGDFFNPAGIIAFDAAIHEDEAGREIHYDEVMELVSKCEDINADTYDNMREAIEENYQKSLEYVQYNGALTKRLQDIVDGINK
jgi:hypothetical protein